MVKNFLLLPKKYLKSRVVVLGNIHPALQLKVLDGLGDDVFVIADTMNLWINTTSDVLTKLIKRQAIATDSKLIWPSGASAGQKAAALVEAEAAFIFTRPGV